MRIGKQGKTPVKLRQQTSVGYKIWMVLRIAILIGIIVFLIWAQHNLVINNEYVYSSHRVPKTFVGYKVVHVSDLYNTDVNVVGSVKRADPDIIVVSGSLMDDKGNYDSSLNILNKLVKEAPCYIVFDSKDLEAELDKKINDNIQILNAAAYTIDAPEINEQAFIEKYVGKHIVNRADRGDEYAKLYIEYTKKTLLDQSNAAFILSGFTFDSIPDNYIELIYDVIGTDKSIFQMSVLNQVGAFNSLANTDVDLVFSGGTLGTTKISKTYTKGAFIKDGTNLFLSRGLGLSEKFETKLFNFPEITTVILSDGTIKNENPLERFIGLFITDVNTKFSEDTGFVTYTKYVNGEEVVE